MGNNLAYFLNVIKATDVPTRYFAMITALITIFYACHQPEPVTKVKVLKQLKTLPALELVSDSITYEFLNFLLANKGLGEISSDAKLADGEFNSIDVSHSKELDSLISKTDRQFIAEQSKSLGSFRLKPSHLDNRSLISVDSLKTLIDKQAGSGAFRDAFRSKYGEGGFYTVSKPLFSRDHQTVIVQVSYHCGGMCGSGNIYIYRKTAGKWRIVEEFTSWIS